ncbi:carboxylesterase family protein [Sphingomonas sp. IC-56]|uniref:carboxylesterase/lipase family protein n=1 Tax=Sphingomonas sp. IC-56 TaxID=2898529 RepID=UPI001E610F25|nr:carboxylesterase family protein [Sphingomonas sp. IC-56]MCD2324440.1 carboxylesterase family protein [Sphingomonas sp. IC-56]
MKQLHHAAFAAALFAAAPALAQSPTVSTPAGAVQGNAQGDLHVFKGIPYAQAPIGTMRWKAPAALPAWTGTRKATAFGPACVQPRPRSSGIYTNPPEQMSEDCLTLNVWAPKNARNLPVFVWIHGGALASGYSHEGMYDGARMAARGMIVVSINYRLGILGYLAHPELSAESTDNISGNYGLLDQIAALRWVKDNIAAFGGDAANVTVAGESAGGLSTLYLMASPQARGLFQRAIAQSAYMISAPELKQARHGTPSAEAAGSQIMTALGAADLSTLRAMDAEKLTTDAAAKGYGPWGTVDGKILTRQLADTWDRGEQAPVPVLAGFNSGEIRSLRILLPPAPADATAYEAAIRARYGDLADAFLRLYPANAVGESMLAATRDALYGWTSTRLAIGQTAIGQRGYLYLFDHGYPAADDNGLHAFHASEIPYVFGTAGGTPALWPKVPDTPAERRMSDAMMAYWSSFAKTGAPVASGQPTWQPYGKQGHYMAFAQAPRPATGLFPGMFALHEAAVCRRGAAGDQPWNWNTGVLSPVLKKADGCR